MKEYWEKHKESFKNAAVFCAGIIIGGCGIAFLANF